LSQNRISEIIGNTSFSNIDNLLTQGQNMEYITAHYQMDLALTWAIRLQGMTDQEKFKELGKIFSPWPIKTQNQQQPWLSSMLTGVILNPHQPHKKNLITP